MNNFYRLNSILVFVLSPLFAFCQQKDTCINLALWNKIEESVKIVIDENEYLINRNEITKDLLLEYKIVNSSQKLLIDSQREKIQYMEVNIIDRNKRLQECSKALKRERKH